MYAILQISTGGLVSGILQWLATQIWNGLTQWAGSLSGLALIVVGFILLFPGRKVVSAVALFLGIGLVIFGALQLFGVNMWALLGL